VKPRVLFVGHTRYDLPLSPSLSKKWAALEAVLEPRVIAAPGLVQADDPRFHLLRTPLDAKLGGGAYYTVLPVLVGAEIRQFRPHAIVCESPYEAFCTLPVKGWMRPSPRLVVEVHGDWRTAARLYGSRWRRLFLPVSDRAATISIRRADATRAVSKYTATLVEEATGKAPLAVFPTYTDIESFLRHPVRPLPEVPTVIWVGVLERYKNADGLGQIWRRVAARLPEARLIVIGQGPFRPLINQLASDTPGRVRVIPKLPPPEVARSLDEATLLFLPSRSEGFPRVIIEAFTRGRPVVARAVGGIPDAVVSERNGLLVHSNEDDDFVEALVRVLSDQELARRLGLRARADAERMQWMPNDYAHAMRKLVDATLAIPRGRH